MTKVPTGLNRIVLHVGPSKTGTTAVQNALSAVRAELQQYGVCYPTTLPESNEGHPSLAWEVLDHIGRRYDRISAARLSWADTFAQARASAAHTLLISTEEFTNSAFDREAFGELKQKLNGVPTSIVFGLRDPVTLVPSAWRQAVKWGYDDADIDVMSLDDAAAVLLQKPRVAVIPYLEPLIDELQPSEVRLFTVPRHRAAQTLLTRFADSARLPSQVVPSFAVVDVNENRSLHADDIAVLLHLNRILRAKGLSDPGRASQAGLMARSVTLDLLDTNSASSGVRTVLGEPVADLARGVAQRIADWIDVRGFEIVGDIADLLAGDTEPVSVAPPSDAALDRRLCELLAASALRLAQTVLEVQDGRDWWHRNAQSWEESLRTTQSVHGTAMEALRGRIAQLATDAKGLRGRKGFVCRLQRRLGFLFQTARYLRKRP